MLKVWWAYDFGDGSTVLFPYMAYMGVCGCTLYKHKTIFLNLYHRLHEFPSKIFYYMTHIVYANKNKYNINIWAYFNQIMSCSQWYILLGTQNSLRTYIYHIYNFVYMLVVDVKNKHYRGPGLLFFLITHIWIDIWYLFWYTTMILKY